MAPPGTKGESVVRVGAFFFLPRSRGKVFPVKDQVSRTGFPKAGPYLNVVKFVCETPVEQRERIYVGAVHGKPGFYNFCLFPMPVEATPEMKELLRTAESVAKLSSNTHAD